MVKTYKKWLFYHNNFFSEEDNEPLNYFMKVLPKIRKNAQNEQIIEFIQYPGN